MKKDFNIIISGIGGQGVITLTRILSQASLLENYDVKTSELHGLSQRGGSVETHIRFSKQGVFSPLVRKAGANLIISLEAQESLKACYYASKNQTIFLINNLLKPILGQKTTPSIDKISKELKGFSKKTIFIPASQITKEKLKNEIVGGVFLLGYGCRNKIIPLKQTSLLKAIELIVPKKHIELNKKAFNL